MGSVCLVLSILFQRPPLAFRKSRKHSIYNDWQGEGEGKGEGSPDSRLATAGLANQLLNYPQSMTQFPQLVT